MRFVTAARTGSFRFVQKPRGVRPTAMVSVIVVGLTLGMATLPVPAAVAAVPTPVRSATTAAATPVPARTTAVPQSVPTVATAAPTRVPTGVPAGPTAPGLSPHESAEASVSGFGARASTTTASVAGVGDCLANGVSGGVHQ